jgi:hypothetical protein
MAYEQKPNSGALFLNDKKETDKHPDYKGKVAVNGVEMWIAAWVKTSKAGDEYFQLSFSPMTGATKSAAPAPAQARQISRPAVPALQKGATGSGFDDMDDDVPF